MGEGHPLDVVIVILTPPVVPPGLQFLRVFRLLRPLRLLGALSARTLLSPEGVRDAAVLAAIVVLASGAIFYEAEKAEQRVGSIWDGIWWAFGTVSTVGYGDLIPKTTIGRILAIVLMFVGIGFVALLTAFVADRFIRTSPAARREARMLANLESIDARLERLERRHAAG
jgi:voltage-gated potassium channel